MSDQKPTWFERFANRAPVEPGPSAPAPEVKAKRGRPRKEKPAPVAPVEPEPSREWREAIDDEKAADFELFRMYRDLPPRERTVTEVALLMGSQDVASYRKKAKKYDWSSRALAYDAHLDAARVERRAEIEATRANLGDEIALAGFSFLRAGRRRAEQLERAPGEISPKDAIALVREGRALLAGDSAPQRGIGHEIADVLANLSPEDQELFAALLDKAGLDVDEEH